MGTPGLDPGITTWDNPHSNKTDNHLRIIINFIERGHIRP